MNVYVKMCVCVCVYVCVCVNICVCVCSTMLYVTTWECVPFPSSFISIDLYHPLFNLSNNYRLCNIMWEKVKAFFK